MYLFLVVRYLVAFHEVMPHALEVQSGFPTKRALERLPG